MRGLLIFGVLVALAVLLVPCIQGENASDQFTIQNDAASTDAISDSGGSRVAEGEQVAFIFRAIRNRRSRVMNSGRWYFGKGLQRLGGAARAGC